MFQGGGPVLIFSPQGKDPERLCKITNAKAVRKDYDKAVRSYVFSCSGGHQTQIKLPNGDKGCKMLFHPLLSLYSQMQFVSSVGLVQPFLVIQLLIDAQEPFGMEISVLDAKRTKRRLIFSTNFKDVSIHSLHAQVPLSFVKRGRWLNLVLIEICFVHDTHTHMSSYSETFESVCLCEVLDLPSLLLEFFQGSFLSLEEIRVCATCQLRRVFTLKTCPADTTNDSELFHWHYADPTEVIATTKSLYT
jgi:hypothetical protein